MAKRRNGKGTNKKTRGMPDKMSHAKHRMSGKPKAPRHAQIAKANERNRDDRRRAEMRQRRRGKLYASVKEAMSDR